MENSLIILVGPPGSGKSTFTKELRKLDPDIVVVSRDAIRFAFFGKYIGVDEEFVTKVEMKAIRDALLEGKNVVSDNTNLTARFTNRLVDIAYQLGKNVEVVDHFCDVPLDVCLERNKMRDKIVPENVLVSFWNRARKRYTLPERPQPVEPVEPVGTTPAFLVDLDGTLALHNGRSPYDEHLCGSDLPNEPVKAVVQGLAKLGYSPVYVSARQEKSRDLTVAWLEKHDFPHGPLYMRETDDKRKDWVVKNEIYNDAISQTYNVLLCLDDRQTVVDMYRQKGLTVLQVDYGEF